jgi:hypothetical protein
VLACAVGPAMDERAAHPFEARTIGCAGDPADSTHAREL